MRKLNSCKCVGHRATGLTLIRSMSGEKDGCGEMGDGVEQVVRSVRGESEMSLV